GFIGNALTKRLIQKGLDVAAIDLSCPIGDDPHNIQVCDLTKPNSIDRFLNIGSVIFHMAASADVGRSVRNPVQDYNINLLGFLHVLESARIHNCRVIFPSTASIFDPENPLPVTERSYVLPSSPYGASKAAGEAYCRAYFNSYGLDTRIARMFSVYGVGMNRFAIYDMVKKIQKNSKELSIFGDGNQIRDYLYIDDVVTGLIKIAENGSPGEDYNLASGNPVKIMDLAKMIASIMGCPEIKIVPSGEFIQGETPRWYGDISKIKKIGFVPMIAFEDGLKKTIDWLMTAENN
ncbi:MAG: NAD-dependent epimerase/dehydratase family protein, partial [Nitrospirae bacterium]|nr:NAD-dependent epimerase/dehydratase family protein [Nitrospirota bacterium]